MAGFCFTELVGGRVLGIVGLDESTLEQCGDGRLAGPSGPSSADGAVLVAAMNSHEVAYAASGGGWTRFGTRGRGEGQFTSPAATAFLGGVGMVVLDSGNGRLVGLDDISGAGWVSYGHRGRPTSGDPAEGAYADPRGLAVDSFDRIWVADPGAHRVTRIDGLDGAGWTEIALPPAARPPIPYGLCAHRDGVAVIDVANARLLTLGANAVVTASVDLADGSWASPTFVTSLGDDLVVSDVLANELRLLDWDGAGFAVAATLRGSPPHLLDPLFDSLGGVGS
jgi:hypothetical protein